MDHLLVLLNENFDAAIFLMENRKQIVEDLLRVKQYHEAIW